MGQLALVALVELQLTAEGVDIDRAIAGSAEVGEDGFAKFHDWVGGEEDRVVQSAWRAGLAGRLGSSGQLKIVVVLGIVLGPVYTLRDRLAERNTPVTSFERD
jgi:hypothetical protein